MSLLVILLITIRPVKWYVYYILDKFGYWDRQNMFVFKLFCMSVIKPLLCNSHSALLSSKWLGDYTH